MRKQPVDATSRAYWLGRKAFARGVRCAPVLDKDLMALLRFLNPEGIIGHPATLRAMTDWTAGWTKANLAQEA